MWWSIRQNYSLSSVFYGNQNVLHGHIPNASLLSALFIIIVFVLVINIAEILLKSPRWCNNKCARLECGRSSVRALIGQINDCKIGIGASPLSTQHKELRTKTGWLGIMIMCPSGATCLPTDFCFSENPTKNVGLVQSRHYHHHLIDMLHYHFLL